MKIKKIIYISLSLIILVSILLWTILSSNNYYMYGGSTSVNEFMQYVSNIWNKDKKHKKIIYNSMGSQYGVNSVENKTFNIGFISKDSEDGSTLSAGNKFVDKQYRNIQLKKDDSGNLNVPDDMIKNSKGKFISITIAIDKISIIANPPSWLKGKLTNISVDLNSEKNAFTDIYERSLTWEKLASEENVQNVPNTSTRIIAMARESGSGTRSAFDEKAHIKKTSNASVATSNGMMVQNVINTPNSIGYVSYGFVQNETQNNDYTSLTINGIAASRNNDDYLFSRPFNMILRADKKSLDQAKNLVSFLYDNEYIYQKEGLVYYFMLNEIK